MTPWVLVGVVVGAYVGFRFQAESRLRPSQSRARWIPALIIGGEAKVLAVLFAWIALGAGLGASLGAVVFMGFEAAARG